LHAVIPLEFSKIEAEVPAAPVPAPVAVDAEIEPIVATKYAPVATRRHVITITLHASQAYTCRRTHFILDAPGAEAQAAWVNALWQASVPRSEMISHLSKANKMAEVVARYAETVSVSFPTADDAVLSAGGRARLSALGNIGALAGALRKASASAPAQDLTDIPTIQASATPKLLLARTASGTVVPASSVTEQQAGVEGAAARQAADRTALVVAGRQQSPLGPGRVAPKELTGAVAASAHDVAVFAH
jgi:hypothetical protein